MKPSSHGTLRVHEPLLYKQIHKQRHLMLALSALIFMLLCEVSAAADNGAFYLSQWGSFVAPSGIAVDSDGNVYVADRGNQCIKKFTPNRELYLQWGVAGAGNGQFDHPRSVAVDANGAVYVADTDNNRIQKFTSNDIYVGKWGSQGTGNGQFNGPRGIATDRNGNVYVVDNENNRVQKFSTVPTVLLTFP